MIWYYMIRHILSTDIFLSDFSFIQWFLYVNISVTIFLSLFLSDPPSFVLIFLHLLSHPMYLYVPLFLFLPFFLIFLFIRLFDCFFILFYSFRFSRQPIRMTGRVVSTLRGEVQGSSRFVMMKKRDRDRKDNTKQIAAI